MRAIHSPSKSHFDASLTHLLNTGEKIRPPKGEIAHAKTPGGLFRQIFARYRKEMKLGIVTENATLLTHG